MIFYRQIQKRTKSRTAYGQIIGVPVQNSILFLGEYYKYCVDNICDLNLVPNIPEPEEPDEDEYALDVDGQPNDSSKFKDHKNLVDSTDRLRESIVARRMRIFSNQNYFTQAFMKNHHVYTWQSSQRK